MTTKKGGEGREKFCDMVNDMRKRQRPELGKAWAALSEGYRLMLAKQAGLPASVAEAPLFDLTEEQRRKLLETNHKVAALAVEAAKVLSRSVMSRP